MNDAFESAKVVQLIPPRVTTGRSGGELLDAVCRLAVKHLQQWVNNTFEQVDDALFDLAEKAENNAAQVHYFDGMRDVRKQRPSVERGFLSAIKREFGELAHPRAPSPVAAPVAPSSGGELSLVADTELEESLAITSLITKNESRWSGDLHAVNQRLSVLCGSYSVDDSNNPVAPAILAQSFRHALRELNTDMRVKLIIYKLFDRYVLSALDELYQAVNAELIRADVLPQLHHEILRAPTNTGGPASKDTPAAAAPTPAPALATEAASEIPSDLLQTLHALFSARRAPTSDGTHPADGDSVRALPSAKELLGALSVLQSQIASAGLLPQATRNDASELAHEVTQLKSHLLKQIGAVRGERTSPVATIDEDTIDLVSMLFEFILEDQNLPAPMQVLLARLQIPYLKAALLDRKLFSHRNHPARLLLDSLAEQAKGWSNTSDRDHRVYDMVKAIVEQLLHEFDDNIGIFDRLLVDLQRFHNVHARRSELAEQRVTEAVRGREKLELARRRAGREILDRITQQPLPPLVHGVLARAWANHLVLILLRHGEASSEYRSALNFVDDFIASTRPVTDADSRRLLRQMLPGIELSLREGLANVAFQARDIERLQAQLTAYYRQQLGDEPADAAPTVVEPDPVLLAIPDAIQPLLDNEAETPASPAAETAMVPPDSPYWHQVNALTPGTWLAFGNLAEAMTRAKLSWISPMSQRYLFVNGRGLKVAEYAPEELAVLLADKQAIVLAGNTLFDRAMTAIVGRLSQPDPSHPG